MARCLLGSTNRRPFLHRLRGIKIHDKVFIGDDVYLEDEYAERVEIHKGALIGRRSTLVAHTREPGKIIIEKDAILAAGCIVVCSSGKTLTIGEGAVVYAGSVFSNHISPFTICRGPRINMCGKVAVPLTLDTTHEDFIWGVLPLKRNWREPHRLHKI